MDKVLITGGLGFIGHHLTKLLLNEFSGLQLVIVDNLSSTKINFDWIKNKAEIHICDLQDFHTKHKFTKIYHLASPVGALGILNRNGYIAGEIIELTYKVAELAIRHRSRLLFVSSSEVYGYDGKHVENAVKMVPVKKGTRLEYGLGKLISEEILYNLALDNELEYTICRPFNVCGESQSKELGFVIPTFFHHAIRNEPLPVFMDGSQKRSFCHVDDIVVAMQAIMQSNYRGEIFNIGHDENCMSILELAERIIECTGSKSEIRFVDPKATYGEKYCEAFDKIPDIQKIKELIGWTPRISMNELLSRLVAFYGNEVIIK